MRKRKTLSKIFGTTLVIVVVCLGVVAAQPVAGTTEASDPPCNCGAICVNETGWWRNGSAFNASATPIQDAVNNATSGDTICVKDGNYHENVDVNTANLTIQSENGNANCVVSASSNDHVFDVSADWVNITGFAVKDATGYLKAGIYLGSGVEHCNISNNTATNNYCGVFLQSSSDNTLSNNTCSNNSHSDILLYPSSGNIISNNTCSGNTPNGIYIGDSGSNTLNNNTCSNNQGCGMSFFSSTGQIVKNNVLVNNGMYFYTSQHNPSHWNTHDIDITNTVNGKPVYYYKSTNGGTVPAGAGQVILASCQNMIIENQYLNKATIGIAIGFSSNITVRNNNCSNNQAYGIDIYESSDNTLSNNNCSNGGSLTLYTSSSNKLENNTVSGSAGSGIDILYSSNSNTIVNNTVSSNNYGIYIHSSGGNTIYNNYFNNTVNARDNGNNAWNTTKTLGTNIVGGPYLGGNYWPDYSGVDTNGDGFGDTPYNITGGSNKDYLPLILPGTLEGNVSFTGRGTAPDARWIETFVVRTFEPGNLTNELWNTTATTNNRGVFTMSGVTPGTYDIGIKNCTCLSELETNVVLTAGNTTVADFGTTREGDVKETDKVDGFDFSLLSGAYNSRPGDGNWNADADLNRSGKVDGFDFSLLSGNYNVRGDAYGYF